MRTQLPWRRVRKWTTVVTNKCWSITFVYFSLKQLGINSYHTHTHTHTYAIPHHSQLTSSQHNFIVIVYHQVSCCFLISIWIFHTKTHTTLQLKSCFLLDYLKFNPFFNNFFVLQLLKVTLRISLIETRVIKKNTL